MPRNFKLGIISDEIAQDFDIALELVAEYDLDAVELRSVFGKPLHEINKEQLLEIKEKAKNANVNICGLSAPIFKCELALAEANEHLELLKRYINIAKLLDTDLIRGFSFWARKPFDEAKKEIIEQYKKANEILEGTGIKLAVEYDPSVYASTAKKVSLLLDRKNLPNLYALYDPGNNLWALEEELPFPDAYELLKDDLCHIHLKDAIKKDGEVEAVAIGLGEVDFRGLFKRLIKDNYTGYLAVETHYRLKEKLSEDQLMRPGGNDFSEGGYAASKDCLNHLMDLIKSL